MATNLELYLISYFCVAYFIMLASKKILVTKAKIWVMAAASVPFVVLKFILDYFGIALYWQLLVLTVYFIMSAIAVHRLNHVTKLAECVAASLIYYLCLQGLNTALISLLFGGQINYISNYFLLMILGCNLIIYSFLIFILEVFKAKNKLQLNHQCTLKIANKSINISGFLDTGNGLIDTNSGLPVVVISLPAIEQYLSHAMYADILFATNASKHFEGIHKLKYATVSGVSYMTVFKPKSFMVSGRLVEVAVGITPKNSTGCEALLNVACR